MTPNTVSGARSTKTRHTIQADPDAQRQLLDLQAVDTALAQLEHRRRTLPEHARVATLRAERERLESDLVGADTEVSDLELDQARAESDLEPVRERLQRNNTRVAAGAISDPKALNSMVEEIEHLKRRIGVLEDAELEVMEQLEQATAARDRLRTRLTDLDRDLATVTAERDEKVGALDGDIGERHHDRAEIAPLLPSALLTLYDRIGASHGGVGAAELRARRCTGCQLEINAADLRAFAAAAPDAVLRCEECGRILVRTPQSGI